MLGNDNADPEEKERYKVCSITECWSHACHHRHAKQYSEMMVEVHIEKNVNMVLFWWHESRQ